MNYKWVKSNGRLRAVWLCAAAALSVAVAGCVTPTMNTGPRVAASFDYTPTQQAEPIDVALNGTYVFAGEPPSLAEVLEHENQFYTDLGKALEGQYVEIMERTHAYLDPREMALVDRQADSLRERKRY